MYIYIYITIVQGNIFQLVEMITRANKKTMVFDLVPINKSSQKSSEIKCSRVMDLGVWILC